MIVQMTDNWTWKGGLLRNGQQYHLTFQECQTLVDLGKAVLVELESTAEKATERAVRRPPARRTRKRANTTKK